MWSLYTDRRCLSHHVPFGFPEHPGRLEALLEWCEERRLQRIEGVGGEKAAEAAEWAIRQVHDGDYVERFRRAAGRGDGLLDSADNPLGRDSFDAARAAVETALSAADASLEGIVPFVGVRPPGHHAERAVAMGFCFFNNVAVAAEHLIAARGLERVAIFDFDVHHGNGTQHLFEGRPEILYTSVHQYPFYPGTGARDERGVGRGEGATVNVPLPAGCGDREYRQALDEIVFPALSAFSPDALLISAGFDAWRGDPLGGMRVTAEGFASWGERLGAFAGERCGGRIFSILEGGYDVAAVPGLVETYMDGVARGLDG